VTVITYTTVSIRKQLRHSPVGAGGGKAHHLLPPASRAILGHLRRLHILASSTTRSYKSTQTQRAACLSAGMNRYPNF